MGADETRALFDQIAKTLEAKIPEGQEAEYATPVGEDASRDKIFALVPEELRQRAFTEAMALSDDDAYACVRRVAQRAGLRKDMDKPCFAYFSHPFWRDLFIKANQSDAFKKAKSGG